MYYAGWISAYPGEALQQYVFSKKSGSTVLSDPIRISEKTAKLFVYPKPKN
jgi:hypothetical protein